MSNLDSYATYLFHEGTNYQAYKLLAPSKAFENGVEGWSFKVWAPNAKSVSVIGDFNYWDKNSHKLFPRGDQYVYFYKSNLQTTT